MSARPYVKINEERCSITIDGVEVIRRCANAKDFDLVKTVAQLVKKAIIRPCSGADLFQDIILHMYRPGKVGREDVCPLLELHKPYNLSKSEEEEWANFMKLMSSNVERFDELRRRQSIERGGHSGKKGRKRKMLWMDEILSLFDAAVLLASGEGQRLAAEARPDFERMLSRHGAYTPQMSGSFMNTLAQSCYQDLLAKYKVNPAETSLDALNERVASTNAAAALQSNAPDDRQEESEELKGAESVAIVDWQSDVDWCLSMLDAKLRPLAALLIMDVHIDNNELKAKLGIDQNRLSYLKRLLKGWLGKKFGRPAPRSRKRNR